MCTDGSSCKRRVCFFAHTDNELRKPEEDPIWLQQQLQAELQAGTPYRQQYSDSRMPYPENRGSSSYSEPRTNYADHRGPDMMHSADQQVQQQLQAFKMFSGVMGSQGSGSDPSSQMEAEVNDLGEGIVSGCVCALLSPHVWLTLQPVSFSSPYTLYLTLHYKTYVL
jgi:hypothetical protein